MIQADRSIRGGLNRVVSSHLRLAIPGLLPPGEAPSPGRWTYGSNLRPWRYAKWYQPTQRPSQSLLCLSGSIRPNRIPRPVSRLWPGIPRWLSGRIDRAVPSLWRRWMDRRSGILRTLSAGHHPTRLRRDELVDGERVVIQRPDIRHSPSTTFVPRQTSVPKVRGVFRRVRGVRAASHLVLSVLGPLG